MNYILLFGSEQDPHLQTVHNYLKKMKAASIIFDINNNDHSITLEVNDKGTSGICKIGNTRIKFEKIAGVWWRNKPNPYIGEDINEKSIKEFISIEWRFLLSSLYHFTPNAVWINNPLKQYEINFKAYQLLIAQTLGFYIPNTIMTNSSCDIIPYFKNDARIIYKQLGWTMFPNGDVIYTSEINKEQVIAQSSNLKLTPGIFQEYIEKDYELRVTVVGNEVFAIKINSQQQESTVIDWRHDQLCDMYEIYNLSETIKQKLIEFNFKAGINFGAYDLIKTKNGKYIFLECNPSGQWLWLEEKINGIHISESLAKLLIAKM
ncbi:hypothetical protein ACPCHR_24505 [Bacillus bombysepticus]